MAVKEILIVGGVGLGAYLLLNMFANPRSLNIISSAIRYPGKVARATGEAKQVVNDVRNIADDLKGIKDVAWSLFDTTDDADSGFGGMASSDFFGSWS